MRVGRPEQQPDIIRHLAHKFSSRSPRDVSPVPYPSERCPTGMSHATKHLQMQVGVPLELDAEATISCPGVPGIVREACQRQDRAASSLEVISENCGCTAGAQFVINDRHIGSTLG